MPYTDQERQRAYGRDWIRRKYQDPVWREQHKAKIKVLSKIQRQLRKDAVAEFRKNGCAACPEKDPACLHAHHRDPAQKQFVIGRSMGTMGIDRLLAELAKCVCLCANCHAKLHAGRDLKLLRITG